MKLSAIPIIAGFATWIFITGIRSDFTMNGAYTKTWSYGPYCIVVAIVLAIAKGIHYVYYNSRKKVA
jgi:hypothetical protein